MEVQRRHFPHYSLILYEPYRGIADSDAEAAVVGVHHTDGGVRGAGEVQAVGAARDHLSHTTALRVLASQHHCTPTTTVI